MLWARASTHASGRPLAGLQSSKWDPVLLARCQFALLGCLPSLHPAASSAPEASAGARKRQRHMCASYCLGVMQADPATAAHVQALMQMATALHDRLWELALPRGKGVAEDAAADVRFVSNSGCGSTNTVSSVGSTAVAAACNVTLLLCRWHPEPSSRCGT
jgi:hypothetical protein